MVILLARNDPGLQKLGVAFQFDLVQLSLRLVAGKGRLRLRERSEEGLIVERDEQIAALDELPLMVMHLFDDGGDLRFHRNGLERLACADGVQFHRNRTPLDLGDDDRHSGCILRPRKRTARARSLRRTRAVAAARQREQQQQHSR